MRCKLVFLGLILALATSAGASVPERIAYQGYLEEDGNPVTGHRDLVFAFYALPTGGTALWSETHSEVTIDRGVFNVDLGSTLPLTPALFDRHGIYLETRVNGVPLVPRREIDSVPYALRTDEAAHALAATSATTATHATVADSAVVAARAIYADSCGSGGGSGGDPYWAASGANIHNTNTGNVGIGTSTPVYKLHVLASGGANPVAFLRNTGTGPGLRAETAGASGTGIFASGNYKGIEAWGAGSNGIGVYGGGGPSGTSMGVQGVTSSTDGMGVSGIASATTGGTYGVHGSSESPDGFGVGGTNLSATGWPVGVRGKVANVSGTGVYGICDAVTGGGYGVHGYARSGSSIGVYGQTVGTNGTGVHGSAAVSGGTGVKGLGGATGVYGEGSTSGGSFFVESEGPTVAAVRAIADADENDGVHAEASGVGARAVFGSSTMNNSVYGAWGGYFLQAGGWGAAVYGEASNSVSGAYSYGGQFLTSSPNGNGVFAENLNTTSNSAGVYGKHAVTDNYGIGVYGDGGDTGVKGEVTSNGAAAYYGVHGTVSGTAGSARGVYGAATTNGVNYGVYGAASGGTTNWAGYFSGNVNVTGTLSKSAGSFKIDHPLDPAGKYLLHSFVESPDMKNVYDGVVELNGSGEAVVTLPDWFEELNRDFRYQLTCIGGYAPVYIAEEVSGNRFRIAGGHAGLRVSWQVTGIRHDPYADANRIPVEVTKPFEEQGTYLHPEAYGVSPDLQVDRVREARDAER
jgi:trimeric autotransporter adhesin